jgi:hypothetical protein
MKKLSNKMIEEMSIDLANKIVADIFRLEINENIKFSKKDTIKFVSKTFRKVYDELFNSEGEK